MAKKKAVVENEVFYVDDHVKIGEYLPANVSSVIDQKSGRELTRQEAANMPAADCDIVLNHARIDKG